MKYLKTFEDIPIFPRSKNGLGIAAFSNAST